MLKSGIWGETRITARTIGIVQVNGGAIRFTVSTTLAGELSKQGKTVLIDGDMPQGTSASCHAVRQQAGKAGNLIADIVANMKPVEAMLYAQAMSLQTMFTNLARRAAIDAGEYMDATDKYMRLALKARSQCRATMETLPAAIQGPIPMLRILSLIFFLIAVFTTPFALMAMMKPSVMPLPTILGAGLLPAFFWWFAFLLHKRANAVSQAKRTEKP